MAASKGKAGDATHGHKGVAKVKKNRKGAGKKANPHTNQFGKK